MYGHTCDGVGVEVPGLFRHVEDARDEGLRPGRQFTEKQSKRARSHSDLGGARTTGEEIPAGDKGIQSELCAIYSQTTCRLHSA